LYPSPWSVSPRSLIPFTRGDIMNICSLFLQTFSDHFQAHIWICRFHTCCKWNLTQHIILHLDFFLLIYWGSLRNSTQLIGIYYSIRSKHQRARCGGSHLQPQPMKTGGSQFGDSPGRVSAILSEKQTLKHTHTHTHTHTRFGAMVQVVEC
jgi:hypothetical protein